MDRRTFLKAVFAASVAPASCVKSLYRPSTGLTDGEISDLISVTLHDLPRGALRRAFQEAGDYRVFDSLYKPKQKESSCSQ
jgi:hypothetical protein